MYHLKLVGRQIFQRKGYFVINTIGLAVALTASVFIYTFLVKEWQTNTFHENVDHIYRITVQTDGNTYWGAEVCSSLGEIAKAELPEVADYTRIITAREMKFVGRMTIIIKPGFPAGTRIDNCSVCSRSHS